MTDRKGIIERVIEAFKAGKLPMSIKVDDLDRDREKISLGFLKRGYNKDIDISTEKDRSLLWFRKRK